MPHSPVEALVPLDRTPRSGVCYWFNRAATALIPRQKSSIEMIPERFSTLPDYAFPRLRALLDAHAPGGEVVHMSIGEPKHAFPGWIMDEITAHSDGFGQYPVNEGMHALLEAAADWVQRRYGVRLDPATRLMALNGTREGLYNAMMALCPERKRGQVPLVVVPNPFYQVYMVAALSVGAEPVFVNATAETGYLPDLRGLSPGPARPGGGGLSLFAVQSAGRGGLARLLGRADRAGRAARFPHLRRRVLCGDLSRHPARGRAGGGRGDGRRP